MTQESVPTPAAAPAQAANVPPTVGGALRALRTARGWSLEDVSTRIKFSPRQLQALEEERWESLPTGVSLRGLIRNYARLLGADGDVIAASLDGVAPPAAPGRPPVNGVHPRTGAGLSIEDERAPTSSWGWLIAILAVVAIAVAYAFWQGWLPQEWLSFQWLAHVITQ
ncbi:membrane protein [Bordetella ansorpii]|uniref:Membrane protein n=1 Tax=Bordetella ansorpii TaxID=288768 RepID=A0A157RH55_9BORD|nr:helix-turn-helix transcriptional regulator [Bordetella ansorpii]SAI57266.1 membrane protein [Bordetella ansorpii]